MEAIFKQLLPKGFQSGTHRLYTPDETLKRIQPFMPIMGITRIANVTGLDHLGIPVAMVIRPNSRSVAVSQGKGLTLAAAKVSGLMESIEGYHAENIQLPLKLASYEELRYTHALVELDKLPLTRYSNFDPNLRILWIEGYDLLNQRNKWLPYELVHTDYTKPNVTGSGCFQATSNGLASGNHVLEATIHAINEVIERDANCLWNLLPEPQRLKTLVNLATIDDPNCQWVLGQYQQGNIHVAVWDMTSNVGLPTFACMIVDQSGHRLRPLYATYGSGCHLSREIALLRALTEAAQVRLTVISGARDDITRDLYERYRHPDVLEQFLESLQKYSAVKDFSQIPSYPYETFNEDLDRQLVQLQAVGIQEVVVVNLTKAEFRIPVVRVVIPGLEGVDDYEDYVPNRRAIEQRQRYST
jgi:ribosomal protein S12 methylthiotransferase accessory factor